LLFLLAGPVFGSVTAKKMREQYRDKLLVFGIFTFTDQMEVSDEALF